MHRFRNRHTIHSDITRKIMFKIAQKYGITAGLVLSVAIGIEYTLLTSRGHFGAAEAAGYITMFLVMLAVYFSIRQYKAESRKERFSYTDGLKAGALTAILSSGFFGIFSYVLYRFIAPDFVDNYLHYQREQLQNSGKSQEVIQQQLQQLEQMPDFFSSPVFQALIMFLTTLFIGMLITLISAAMLRDRKKG